MNYHGYFFSKPLWKNIDIKQASEQLLILSHSFLIASPVAMLPSMKQHQGKRTL